MRHTFFSSVTAFTFLVGCAGGDGAPVADASPDRAAVDSGPADVAPKDGAVVDAASEAEAAPPEAGLECGLLAPGQELAQGQKITSCTNEGFGMFDLAMQTDGNFVLYQNDVCTIPTWATSTNGKGGTKAVMQTDGDFVVLDSSAKVLWHSNTAGHAGAHVAVQGDGNLVVYDGTTPVWDAGTWHEKPTKKLWIAQDGATANSSIQSYWHIVLEMSLNFTRMQANWSSGRALEFGGYKVLGTSCSVVHSTSASVSQDSTTLQCIENQTGWSIATDDVILYYPQGYGCQDGRNHWHIPVTHGNTSYSVEAAFGFTGSGTSCQEALGSHEVYEASASAAAADCCNGQDGCPATPSPYGWYTFSLCGSTWSAQAVSPTPATEYTASACTKLQF